MKRRRKLIYNTSVYLAVIFISTYIVSRNLLFAGIVAIAAFAAAILLTGLSRILFDRPKLMRIYNILLEECDPDAYIRETKKLKEAYKVKYESSLKKRTLLPIDKSPERDAYKSLQTSFDSNIATGLACLGQYDEALDIFRTIDVSEASDVERIFHHGLMMECYARKGDFENAAFEYENYVRGFEEKITVQKQLDAFNYTVALCRFLQSKNPDSARYFLKQVRELEENDTGKQSTCSKLSLMYDKAVAELITGDTRSALEKFKTVAEQGNKLWIAKLSRDKVDELT